MFCASFPLFALDNKFDKYFSFSITPQFEIAKGNIKEYVFESACKNTDNMESMLNWDVRTISLLTLKANFNILKYISVGVSGTATVPQRSGFMQDSDWLNSVSSLWINDDPTERTDYSEHRNQLDKFVSFRINLGANIYLPAEIKLRPYIGYNYEFIKFTASGGYGIYKSNNYDTYPWSGKVIAYEQESNTMLLGLTDISPRTSIIFNFDFSPKMNYLNAIDFHYTRNLAFWDKFKKTLLIESDLTAQYRFTKNHSAGFSARVQYIPLSKGTTYSKNLDANGNLTSGSWIPLSGGNGGTDRLIWAFGLNYSFSL